MRLDDNIHLDQGYVAAVKRAHTGGLYKRFVEGLFADVGAGSFDFDYSVHVQGFVLPDIRRVVYGVDFGWTNPSAVVVIVFDGDGRAFIIDEVYKPRMSEETLIKECLDLQLQWGKGIFWCDSSEPRTISQMMRAGLDARGNSSKRDDGIREIGGRLGDAGDGRRRLYVSPECVDVDK